MKEEETERDIKEEEVAECMPKGKKKTPVKKKAKQQIIRDPLEKAIREAKKTLRYW